MNNPVRLESAGNFSRDVSAERLASLKLLYKIVVEMDGVTLPIVKGQEWKWDTFFGLIIFLQTCLSVFGTLSITFHALGFKVKLKRDWQTMAFLCELPFPSLKQWSRIPYMFE